MKNVCFGEYSYLYCNVSSSFGIYYVALYVHASVKNKSVNITDTLYRGVARPGHQLTLPGHQHYVLSKKWRQTRVKSIDIRAQRSLTNLDGLTEF